MLAPVSSGGLVATGFAGNSTCSNTPESQLLARYTGKCLRECYDSLFGTKTVQRRTIVSKHGERTKALPQIVTKEGLLLKLWGQVSQTGVYLRKCLWSCETCKVKILPKTLVLQTEFRNLLIDNDFISVNSPKTDIVSGDLIAVSVKHGGNFGNDGLHKVFEENNLLPLMEEMSKRATVIVLTEGVSFSMTDYQAPLDEKEFTSRVQAMPKGGIFLDRSDGVIDFDQYVCARGKAVKLYKQVNKDIKRNKKQICDSVNKMD